MRMVSMLKSDLSVNEPPTTEELVRFLDTIISYLKGLGPTGTIDNTPRTAFCMMTTRRRYTNEKGVKKTWECWLFRIVLCAKRCLTSTCRNSKTTRLFLHLCLTHADVALLQYQRTLKWIVMSQARLLSSHTLILIGNTLYIRQDSDNTNSDILNTKSITFVFALILKRDKKQKKIITYAHYLPQNIQSLESHRPLSTTTRGLFQELTIIV